MPPVVDLRITAVTISRLKKQHLSRVCRDPATATRVAARSKTEARSEQEEKKDHGANMQRFMKHEVGASMHRATLD